MRLLWAQICYFAKNPSQFWLFLRTHAIPENAVTRAFPVPSLILRAHEAAYLVSLWQLDLERAETAEVPRWPPKDVLKS